MASTHMVSSRESLPDEVALDILHRSKSPDSGMHTSQSSQEGTPPCNVLEKITDDGYNWRKYGQKNVKGNEFVRSYYKCTHFKCLVKKRVERSRDGQIKDTIYFGGHCHPITQSLPPIAATLALSGPEEKPNVPLLADTDEKAAEEHGRSIQLIQPMDLTPRCTILANDDGAEVTPLPLTRKRDEVDKDEESQVKRQKKECSRGNTTPRDKPTCEPRVVVQTLSEIDIVSDGYRWRKYGQKFVKGNPNPRSYYRCSSAGCPVKKHVERASYDPKVVITTYEGQHDHNIPPARIVTVTHHTSGESSTKSLASDIVVYTPTSINTRSTEQLKGEARSHAIDFIAYTPTSSNIKSTEQLNCESRAHASEIVAYTPTSPNTRSTEQLNGESRSISHDIDTGCLGDVLINHCPDTDNVCSDPLAIEPKKNAEENLTVSSDMVVTTDMVSEKLYGSMCNKSEETQRLHHGNSMVRKVEESKTVCCDVVTSCFPVPKNNSIELRVVEPQNNSEELAIIGRDQNKSSEQVNGKVRLNVSEGNGILSHDTVHRTVSITESNSNSLRSESEQNVKVNPNTAVRVSSCPEQVPNSQQTVKAEPVQI